MAKYFKFIVFFSLTFLTSCQEGGEAGDLWGQWRMTDSNRKYLSFSGSVTLFRDTATGIMVYGNFQHVGDSLFIQCYSEKGLPTDTTVVEETFGFKPFNNIRVRIDALGGKVLVLSKDGQTWNFHKY